MEPILSAFSDRLASVGYLSGFVVCATWSAIAVGHMLTRRHMIRWLMLALCMVSAAVALCLMGIYTGWRMYAYLQILAVTRLAFTSAAMFGAIFTVMYLWTIWSHGREYHPHANFAGVD